MKNNPKLSKKIPVKSAKQPNPPQKIIVPDDSNDEIPIKPPPVFISDIDSQADDYAQSTSSLIEDSIPNENSIRYTSVFVKEDYSTSSEGFENEVSQLNANEEEFLEEEAAKIEYMNGYLSSLIRSRQEYYEQLESSNNELRSLNEELNRHIKGGEMSDSISFINKGLNNQIRGVESQIKKSQTSIEFLRKQLNESSDNQEFSQWEMLFNQFEIKENQKLIQEQMKTIEILKKDVEKNHISSTNPSGLEKIAQDLLEVENAPQCIFPDLIDRCVFDNNYERIMQKQNIDDPNISEKVAKLLEKETEWNSVKNNMLQMYQIGRTSQKNCVESIIERERIKSSYKNIQSNYADQISRNLYEKCRNEFVLKQMCDWFCNSLNIPQNKYSVTEILEIAEKMIKKRMTK